MKKLEMVIKPEKLENLKSILDDSQASGVMITNIMGYGNQKGFTRMYRGTTYAVNLLPKVKVETVVADDAAEEIISRVVKEITKYSFMMFWMPFVSVQASGAQTLFRIFAPNMLLYDCFYFKGGYPLWNIIY